jgi:hypothetical protein
VRPDRPGPLAYWHCGGSIEHRSAGSLTQLRAAQLFEFYAAEALDSLAAGDFAAAEFCARTGIEIADAIFAAAAWRRTACAGSVRPRGDS